MRVHEFVFTSVTGANITLERWTGQPLLLVNTASECGFTPQYTKLQKLWDEYRRSGLIVIGVPCNEFGDQEPGSDAEIARFCTERYSVERHSSTLEFSQVSVWPRWRSCGSLSFQSRTRRTGIQACSGKQPRGMDHMRYFVPTVFGNGNRLAGPSTNYGA